MGQLDAAEMSPGTGLAVLRVLHEQETPLSANGTSGHRRPDGLLLGGERVHVIRQTITTIGRGLQNAAVLLDPSVSRVHACLTREDGAWTVENLSEHNALWVGSQEVAPRGRAPLPSGETLRLGHTTLQFLAPVSPPAPGAHSTNSTSIPPPAPEPESQTSTTALNLFDPGVTMRFAFSGQFATRTRWVLAIMGTLIVCASAVVTLGTAALVGQSALAAQGIGSVLAAVTIPLVPVLGAAVLVGAIDRYEREPIVLLVAAFAWGALIAIPAALLAERALNAWLQANPIGAGVLASTAGAVAHSALQGLTAGFTEESVKGAGLLVLLVLLRDEFDNVTDGILYGVMIGAGFAMVENFVYFASSPRGDLGFLILGRVILGWLGHSTFTALFGAGLGFARESRDHRNRVVGPLLGFLAAVLLHSIFDFVDFQANAAVHLPHAGRSVAALALIAVIADYLPLFAAQAILVRLLVRSLHRESEVIRAFLAAEVQAGVVSPDEYAMLQKATLRARLERHYFLVWGPRAYLTARALHQTAIGLAFRKWHVAMGDRPKSTPRQPEEVYRERIGRLRRSLLGLVSDGMGLGVRAPTGG
jgi:RsiW-degrading membrane proteinase PrsW (M82 family)